MRSPTIAPALDVHGHRWLVQHQQVGVADERDGEARTLGLAAGELLRPALGDRLDSDQLEHLLDRQGVGVQAGHHREQLAHGEIAYELPGLEHRADRAVHDRLGGRPAEERDRAAVRSRQAEQHVDRRRLAGAVRAEQRDRLARCHRDVDAAHGL
ncbi:MAG TPA: hypothetical protein VIM27_05610, partial [Gaiellales bacterium]